ncbi:Uncharacterized protein Rs2_38950 [Raphanus sativus]|nr:Uncharacterized protein Rs2_38950 [Raphanus sativus]
MILALHVLSVDSGLGLQKVSPAIYDCSWRLFSNRDRTRQRLLSVSGPCSDSSELFTVEVCYFVRGCAGDNSYDLQVQIGATAISVITYQGKWSQGFPVLKFFCLNSSMWRTQKQFLLDMFAVIFLQAKRCSQCFDPSSWYAEVTNSLVLTLSRKIAFCLMCHNNTWIQTSAYCNLQAPSVSIDAC